MKSKPYVRRAFLSLGQRVGKPDACSYSVPYELVEKMVLAALSEITPSDLLPHKPKDADLYPLRLELAGIEKRLEELEAALTTPDTELPQLVQAIRTLQTKRDKLRQTIEKAKQQEATNKTTHLQQFNSIAALLDATPPAERHNLRLKLGVGCYFGGKDYLASLQKWRPDTSKGGGGYEVGWV